MLLVPPILHLRTHDIWLENEIRSFWPFEIALSELIENSLSFRDLQDMSRALTALPEGCINATAAAVHQRGVQLQSSLRLGIVACCKERDVEQQ